MPFPFLSPATVTSPSRLFLSLSHCSNRRPYFTVKTKILAQHYRLRWLQFKTRTCTILLGCRIREPLVKLKCMRNGTHNHFYIQRIKVLRFYTYLLSFAKFSIGNNKYRAFRVQTIKRCQ